MEYFPFSDAKRGPLSNITASGKALMTTFDAGMNAANVDLSGTMEHVLPPAALTSAPAASGGRHGGSVSNSNSISIGDVHLSQDFDFDALMVQINRHQATKRTQRGVV